MLKLNWMFVFLMVFCANFISLPVWAQGGNAVSKAKTPAETAEELVDMGMTRTNSKVDEMERRINSIERELRSIDSRLRSMDRTLDEVRRQIR